MKNCFRAIIKWFVGDDGENYFLDGNCLRLFSPDDKEYKNIYIIHDYFQIVRYKPLTNEFVKDMRRLFKEKKICATISTVSVNVDKVHIQQFLSLRWFESDYQKKLCAELQNYIDISEQFVYPLKTYQVEVHGANDRRLYEYFHSYCNLNRLDMSLSYQRFENIKRAKYSNLINWLFYHRRVSSQLEAKY